MEGYELLKEYTDFNVSIWVDKDYTKIMVVLGYRGISIEFEIVEFITIITTLAQATAELDVDKINIESKLVKIEQELREANALIKSRTK